jgi:hypothetical protein
MLGLLVLAIASANWPHFFERQFMTAIVESERLLHLAR